VKPRYELVVRGNSLRLKDDFIGMANVTLIRAKSGLILFDTGGYPSRLGLLKSLRAVGVEPSDIPLVFLSHLHFDHAHRAQCRSVPAGEVPRQRARMGIRRRARPERFVGPLGHSRTIVEIGGGARQRRGTD
jgi:glyoxylase-like metal-dependent hydrolase (beta-lactamase superfamily II)